MEKHYVMILDYNNPNCWSANSYYITSLPKVLENFLELSPEEQKIVVVATTNEFADNGKPLFNIEERVLMATASIEETKPHEIINMARCLASLRQAFRETQPQWVQAVANVLATDQTIQAEIENAVKDWVEENSA